jgi:glutamate-1-semialdehyde 2,1-aminomutase
MAPTSTTQHLAEKAKQITQRELQTYTERTKASQLATSVREKCFLLGVPSSFQAYDPHPIVVRSAQGSWMEDVDGNRYTDYDMGFGALLQATYTRWCVARLNSN